MEAVFALALLLTKGIGLKRATELSRMHGSFEEAAKKVCPPKAIEDAQSALRRAEEVGARVVTLKDSEYPPLLKEIEFPPPVLFVKGKLPKSPCVSVVGSRKCSSYGRAVASSLGRFLAERGICTVSGLALGIDSEAHAGALEGKGETVAVLGCGIDVIYPRSNASLRKKIERKGAVITEFPPGTKPKKENFPRRNRIIAAISYATVVVEAAKRSGALITASYAVSFNRHVFAVPGNITSPFSVGTNSLIKEGAYPLTDFEDIFSELPFLKPKAEKEKVQLDEKLSKVLSAIDGSAFLDQILSKSGLDYASVISALAELEMRGFVLNEGGRYVKRRLEP